MPSKATHVLTASADQVNDPIARATGAKTVSVSVYGQADLDARTSAASAAGVPVTVKKL